MKGIADCHLCLLFTPAMCAGDPGQTLREAIAGGVDLVQWRVKDGRRDGLAECVAICAELDVPLIVNDDVALAVEIDAAGAHIGQEDMPVAEARAVLGDRWLGLSTHDVTQAREAMQAGVDYIGIGPCFPTVTKGYAEALPTELLTGVLAMVQVPAFAIGGITPVNSRSLVEAGVRRVAVSRAVLCDASPRRVVGDLRRSLKE